VFSPEDGGTNREDLLRALGRAFCEHEDATLVLKISHHDPAPRAARARPLSRGDVQAMPERPESSTRNGRIDDIEILRAFAVAFVVVHHVNGNLFVPAGQFMPRFYGFFDGGVGVDLFFAISGFVIARSLLPALRTATTPRAAASAMLQFWLRRAFRLLPAAWCWLVLILILAGSFNRSGVFGDVRTNLHATWAGMLQYANARFARASGSFPYGVSFVYWSLALEWQFYVVLPLLACTLRRHLPWLLGLWIALLFGRERGRFGMPFRTDALAWGVLIALASERAMWTRFAAGVQRRPRVAAGIALGCLVALPLLGSALTEGMAVRIGAIALVSALLTAIAATEANTFRALLPAPLEHAALWLGSRSYAVYLCQIPGMFLMREVAMRHGVVLADRPILTMIAFMVLIGLCAEATYRWIERPWRLRGRALVTRMHTAQVQTSAT
jgi:peptidoglycan/LPS O-acetylase OafA/YrhL